MLREARAAAGLTQRDVAARLHKAPSYAHKVENADRELNVLELMNYCAVLGVDFVAFTALLHTAVLQFRRAVPTSPLGEDSP